MSDTPWFLRRNGQQFGPYSWEQLTQMARGGQVERHDIVWRQGDAESHQARDLPGLMPTRAGSSRGLIIGLGAGVVALAIALVVVLVSRNGGDDSAADSNSSDTTEAVTTEPARTTTTRSEVTTAVPTTPAPTTVAPSTVPPTMYTLPPTTVLPVATEADLLAALPPTDDLPMGWAIDEGLPTTDLHPQEGPAYGTCSLMNNDRRAMETGMVAHADQPNMYLPDNGYFDLSLYSFPTPEDAARFLALTDEQANVCVDGTEFDIVEGDGPGEYDIFTDPQDDGALWHVVEFETPMLLPAQSADERYAYSYVNTFTTRVAGRNYAATWGEIDLYERYGSVVVVAELYGSWDISGFGSWNEPNYQPSMDVLELALDEVRAGIVDELRGRGLLG